MAYAALANTDYSVGIYTAIFPVFVYLFFGPSHHISFGTNPLTAMIVGECNPNLWKHGGFVLHVQKTLLYMKYKSAIKNK